MEPGAVTGFVETSGLTADGVVVASAAPATAITATQTGDVRRWLGECRSILLSPPGRKKRAQSPTPSIGGRMAVLRSRDDKVIAGICGGIAKSLGWNPTSVRVLYVLVSVLSAGFPGMLVYVILWIVMPKE